MIIHIYHPADRTAVHTHPNLQAWMGLECATDFNRALRRRFLTGVEDQRHPVAGWNFYQSTRSFGFLVLIRTADDSRQLINYCPLLVNRELRVTHNVDEQDMRDLQGDLFLDLCGHGRRMPRELCSLEYLAFIRHVETKAALRVMIGIRPLTVPMQRWDNLRATLIN